jgi:hypothetical protein
MLPFVLVLDLDGTIVGDVSDHIVEWIVLQTVRDKAAGAQRMHAFNRTFRSCLMAGLLRPYFGEFMSAVASHHGIEVFVYTASTKDWAPVVIHNVEQCTGVRFQRPLFTRDHCLPGPVPKSLQSIKPLVFRTLKKKYVRLSSPTDLDGRMVMIDNTDVLAERTSWIPCPTYDFVSNYDVLKNVDTDVLRAAFPIVSREMVRQGALSRAASRQIRRYEDFMSHYYARISKNFAISGAKNSAHRLDSYWKTFATVCLPMIRRTMAANGVLSPRVVADMVAAHKAASLDA